MDKITVRCSEISDYLGCRRRAVLKVFEPKEESDQQRLGTEIHTILNCKLTGKPIPEMSQEAKKVLCVPATFDNGLDLSIHRAKLRGVPIAVNAENFDLGSSKYYINKDTIYSTIAGKPLDIFPQSVVEEYTAETTILEAINPNIIPGVELTKFEQNAKASFMVDGTIFEISGTFDAASQDLSTILDFKTASQTPSTINPSYALQQILYKSLMCKSERTNYTGSTVILGYIIKTKKPKFLPIRFTITEAMIRFADKVLIDYSRDICNYKYHGTVPPESFNQYCGYCSVFHICNILSPLPQKIERFV